jgi:hypothetical protein
LPQRARRVRRAPGRDRPHHGSPVVNTATNGTRGVSHGRLAREWPTRFRGSSRNPAWLLIGAPPRLRFWRSSSSSKTSSCERSCWHAFSPNSSDARQQQPSSLEAALGQAFELVGELGRRLACQRHSHDKQLAVVRVQLDLCRPLRRRADRAIQHETRHDYPDKREQQRDEIGERDEQRDAEDERCPSQAVVDTGPSK